MAKKRKASGTGGRNAGARQNPTTHPEDHFNDSEDEFFTGRDKILLDEEPTAKRRRRLQEQEAELQPSDEEVFQDAASDNESIDDQQSDLENAEGAGPDAEDGEQDDGYWGTSRGDYYNADVIETEADALEEEAEAKRLQQKQLQAMTDADFGFDEATWADDAKDTTKTQRPAVEKLPDFTVPEDATTEERRQILRTRYPEFEFLANELVELQSICTVLEKDRDLVTDSDTDTSVVYAKITAIMLYMGAIMSYMAIMTSPSKSGMAMNPAELHEHPVMKYVLKGRELWNAVKNLEVGHDDESESQDEAAQSISDSQPEYGYGSDLESAVVEKMSGSRREPSNPISKKPATKKRAQPSASSSPEPNTSHHTTTKTKNSRKKKRNDLQTLLDASLQQAVEESDFGDEAPLTQAEAEEKARKKRSLRFYTSQIAQKANKRGAASRHAGGDDDIPHKERIRDRQDRLMREAEQRGKSGAHDLEALDTDDEDMNVVRQNHEESNDYYASLITSSKQKKADKKMKADAYAEAARLGAQVYEEEQVGADGKRKITYAIEKNKGLAPKRKKDVRNPRVKKRKKYDEKMKKLSSIRQVYKGGEGRGGYGGEATGIKTNLVKSTKL
ncbi:hypothetical protein LTR84_008602 [Exophiala bonariae]|uniref:Sas10 C-terminal domain-containing protein n=1 Tax=Exophiala bonariae TaxID=1690606 RepID=A0AAV9N0H2_9EURO|nr:hypothetical protein LTR84_008602 [Exophiala bonariae]